MDQRIDMQRLNRCGGADSTGFVDVEQPGGRHHQQGSQPLAATNRGVAHRLVQIATGIIRDRQ